MIENIPTIYPHLCLKILMKDGTELVLISRRKKPRKKVNKIKLRKKKKSPVESRLLKTLKDKEEEMMMTKILKMGETIMVKIYIFSEMLTSLPKRNLRNFIRLDSLNKTKKEFRDYSIIS